MAPLKTMMTKTSSISLAARSKTLMVRILLMTMVRCMILTNTGNTPTWHLITTNDGNMIKRLKITFKPWLSLNLKLHKCKVVTMIEINVEELKPGRKANHHHHHHHHHQEPTIIILPLWHKLNWRQFIITLEQFTPNAKMRIQQKLLSFSMKTVILMINHRHIHQ